VTAIEVTVNGRRHREEVAPRLLASDFLRHVLGLTGTHVGCEHGVCGACTVHVDGEAVRSCLLLAVQLDGAEVETVEGLAPDGGLTPLQAVQTATLNVAQAWGKDKEYGSVEKGKVADFFIVGGDPLKNISDTQNVEMVFSEGKKIDTAFHADYKNPLPRPIEDRPEQ
jgi:cytosine/adenosine deaminase-related metal-dependent hydrolase